MKHRRRTADNFTNFNRHRPYLTDGQLLLSINYLQLVDP
uniref:Uncharacterized protein n=1 Tax=Rhizophora mucronata TaxID=61149 RepID=A0A2P2QDA1_RHIMU